MKHMLFRPTLCFCTILVLFLAFAVPPGSADTNVGGSITTDTTWALSGSPYIVTAPISVYGTDGADGITTLTIEPGVQVRFNASYIYLLVGSSGPGALIAQGTSTDPVVFTSNQPAPTPGAWQGIWIEASADDATTRLEHCAFEYAGTSQAAVYINGAAPTLQNCTFSNSGNYDLKYGGAVGGSVSGCTFNNGVKLLSTGTVGFSDNTFNYNNGYPIIAKLENLNDLLNGNTFNNVDASSYIEASTGTIVRDADWAAIMPIHINGNITVQGTDGADGVTTLTLEPGLQIRFMTTNAVVSVGAASGAPGALAALGTAAQPIVFSSNSASPAAGDWGGIKIYNTADDGLTRLEHCLIQYTGRYNYPAVQITDAAPTLDNCTFTDSAYYDLVYTGTVGGTVSGCTINNGIKLDATSSVDFNGNTINYTDSRPIIAKGDRVGNLVTGNTYNNLDAASYLQVNADTIIHDAVWSAAVPLYIAGNLTVKGTDGADGVTTLTIEPGAIIKFIYSSTAFNIGAASGDPGALIAQGQPDHTILFSTSMASPAPGAWDTIHFYATAAPTSALDYVVLEYGGHYSHGPVYLDNAKVAVRNCIIRNNYMYGLYISGTAANGAEITCNTFENNGTGLITKFSALPLIEYNNFIGNTSYGLQSNSAGLVAENNWWNDPAGPNQSGDQTYGSVDFDPWSTQLNQCQPESSNQPPNQPAGPSPEDNAVNVSPGGGTTTVVWAGGDPDPEDTVVYDIYTGTAADTLTSYAQDIAGATYALSGLSQGMTYYWQVVARDSYGLESTGPVWRFTTAGDPPDLIIGDVTTNPPGHLQPGQAVTITATVLNNGTGPVVNGFTVLFKVDNVEIGMPAVTDIMLAGQSVALTLPWSYPGGNPTIDILADNQNAIVETDNQNNFFTAGLYEVADMTAPALTATTPLDDAYLQQAGSISATLTDTQSAVDDTAVIAGFTVTDSGQQTVQGTVGELNDTFTFTPANAPLADGTYTAVLVAADIHGNTQNYNFAFTVDSQPPAKPVITGGAVTSGTIQARPAQNISNQFVVELTGIRDPDTSLLIESVERVGLGDTPWSVQLTLSAGDNAFEMRLRDRAGNLSEAEWVDIRTATADAVHLQYDASGRTKHIDTTP